MSAASPACSDAASPWTDGGLAERVSRYGEASASRTNGRDRRAGLRLLVLGAVLWPPALVLMLLGILLAGAFDVVAITTLLLG
jgi:hypothetical protein